MQEHRVMEMKLKASMQLLCTFICWRGSWKQLRKSKLASSDHGVSLRVLLCKGKFPCCCSDGISSAMIYYKGSFNSLRANMEEE
ncbi:unnamed protein product [Linum tenue]|uniref:Uncharacterized protein n=1 Tax=Linum tenue TaxID=586396 RepID=A0AAV0NN01_9ROSI|nr:unnamed protein product [Linum tenue]